MARPAFKPNKRVPDGTTRAVIAHLYEQAGGAKAVGFALGLAMARTYQIAEEGTLSLDDAARLTFISGGTAAAEYLATLAGGIFLPVAVEDAAPHALLSRSASEHGEVMALALSTATDGVMDATEAGRIAAEIDDTIRVLVAARQKLTPAFGA